MADVVAIGELLIDFATLSRDNDGYPTMAAHAGGAPANFLATLAKYGISTAMIAKIGSDAFGKLLISTLDNAGIVSDNIISTSNYFTTLAFVTIDTTGNREFSFARKPGADTMIREDEINWSAIEQAKVFHFGSLSLTDEPARSATYKAVEYAKNLGKIISYDPNYRAPLWENESVAKSEILKAMSYADVVKISDEEVSLLFDCTPEEGAEIILHNYNVSLVYVTLGSKGCFYATDRVSGRVPGLSNVKAVDTTGAGDIFGGTAMYKLLQIGKSPLELDANDLESICSTAVKASGLSVTKIGGIPSIPKLEEL